MAVKPPRSLAPPMASLLRPPALATSSSARLAVKVTFEIARVVPFLLSWSVRLVPSSSRALRVGPRRA